MRTIIDIPEELLIPLDRLAKEEDISRAEAIRRAVTVLLAEQKPSSKNDTALNAFFGMWKDRDDIGDAVEYQRKLRSEWDE